MKRRRWIGGGFSKELAETVTAGILLYSNLNGTAVKLISYNIFVNMMHPGYQQLDELDFVSSLNEHRAQFFFFLDYQRECIFSPQLQLGLYNLGPDE